MSEMREGAPVAARRAHAVINCGIEPFEGMGHIVKMDPTEISIYYRKEDSTVLKMVMTRAIFEVNFKLHPFGQHNLRYVQTEHFTKRFPDDFLLAGYMWKL